MGTCHDGTPKFRGFVDDHLFFKIIIRVTRPIIAFAKWFQKARSQKQHLQLESQLLSGGGTILQILRRKGRINVKRRLCAIPQQKLPSCGFIDPPAGSSPQEKKHHHQLLQSDLLIPPNGGHPNPLKRGHLWIHFRGHFEEPHPKPLEAVLPCYPAMSSPVGATETRISLQVATALRITGMSCRYLVHGCPNPHR